MNFKRTLMAGIAALLPMAAPVSAATLVGDTIDIVGYFPNLTTVNNSGTVVVNNGDADRVTFGGGSFAHADALQLSFIAPNATTFANAAANVISFEGLDFDDGSVISGVSLLSTFGGIGVGDLTFGDDFVRFDVAALSPAAGDSIVVALETTSPVPLPAGLPLLALGICALGMARRKKSAS